MQTKNTVSSPTRFKRPTQKYIKRLEKMSANDRVLLVAGINASLSTWDGYIPNNLRVDHNTLELFAICPVPEGAPEVIERMLRPVLSALKSAKRRAK